MQAAYQRVYKILKDQIINNKLSLGDKLPSERELCEEYGVSRITIRHALRLLQDTGLLVRDPGRGTFIKSAKPPKVPILDMQYAESLKKGAPNTKRRVLACREGVPPDEISRTLRLLKLERCLCIERLDTLDGDPLSYDQGYIPLEYSALITDEMLIRIDFLDLWLKSAHLNLSHTESAVEAVSADRIAVERLGVSEGSPILMTTELMFLADGNPFAVFLTAYRGDRFKLVSTVKH